VRATDGGSTPTEDAALQRDSIAWAGWHPDPFDLAGERWWDGTRWTGHVRGAPAGAVGVVSLHRDGAFPEHLRGVPPGWYAWRGQVARWWDGSAWGEARRPFADHVRPSPQKQRRRRPRFRLAYGAAAVLVAAAVTAVVLWAAPETASNATRSITVSYRASVGRLCSRLFAQERAEIVRRSAAAVSGQDPPQAVLVGQLLRAVSHDTAMFDEKLRAMVPPPGLRATEQHYLSLEGQNSAIYGLVIPRVEGRGGLSALDTVTSLLSRNAPELQTLLTRLGGPACSGGPLA
jgi:Protein of unknown function (DUF2510)